MSKETCKAINDAIVAHLQDECPNAILTDYFVAYAFMKHDPNVEEGIVYLNDYVTSITNPNAILGTLTVNLNKYEAATFGQCCCEEDDD